MRKNFFKSSIVLIALLTLQFCTQQEDSTINQVLDDVSSGGVLRTISETSKTFNFFNTSSKWSIIVEAQDASDGQLLREVRLFTKRKVGNTFSAERIVKTIPAASFNVAGARSLPQSVVDCTLSEVLTALTIPAGGYSPSDSFIMRLEYIMKDGRIFSVANTSTPVTNGYFSSPFQYTVQFFCPVTNAANFSGNYKVVADAWEDYSIGATIPVTYNATDGIFTFRILNSNNPYINNPSSYYIITINPADGSVKGSSNVGLAYSGTPAVTNVSITGTVGTCTGDINLSLNFTGHYTASNQTFKLTKI